MKRQSQVEVAGHDPEASIPQTTITQTTITQTTILQTTIAQATIPQTTIRQTLYRQFHDLSHPPLCDRLQDAAAAPFSPFSGLAAWPPPKTKRGRAIWM